MLYEHPKVEGDSARIRLAGFDKGALSLEIFSYIITREQAEFSAICENVWLRMMEIVENSGSGFAGPSQTVHFSRDSGLDKDKAVTAEQQLQQMRGQKKVPFPDFTTAARIAFGRTMCYSAPYYRLTQNK